MSHVRSVSKSLVFIPSWFVQQLTEASRQSSAFESDSEDSATEQDKDVPVEPPNHRGAQLLEDELTRELHEQQHRSQNTASITSETTSTDTTRPAQLASTSF
eukprot:m.319302 g.319302  ORF g.319302 m.319302 type:complete len:102 (-) comp55492_c0_seq2:1040-1345(-)